MNILVTGANGQLGNEIRLLAPSTSDHFLFTDVCEQEGVETTPLDITNLAEVQAMVAEHHIDLIINCAAYTNVDKAESDAELCERLNHHAVENLATAMKAVDGWLVHVSTDYVFGGDPYNTPCREDQTGTPTGVYGASKLRGEQAIARVGCHHLIFRTAWLYSRFGKNFVKTMLHLTATKRELKVVFDQCGTPTFAGDLAKALIDIIDQRKLEGNEGIYHYSNEGVTSWYDFTQMIACLAGNVSCRILPCYSSEYPSPVKRPAYSVLDKTKFKETFQLSIPYWIDSLQLCIRDLCTQ